MSQKQTVEPKVSTQDDLDRLSSATQELHQSISSVLTKRAAATSADAEKLVQQAKDSAELASTAIRSYYETAEKQVTRNLEEAAKKLRKAQKETAKSLESTGQDCQAFLTSALAETKAAAHNVSEAVAARHSGRAPKQKTSNPKK